MKSPVYNIKAIPIEDIQANSYNPNHVAPPEMKLLYESIKQDGYTMPIVVYPLGNGKYEIVDGYHRSCRAASSTRTRATAWRAPYATTAPGARTRLS